MINRTNSYLRVTSIFFTKSFRNCALSMAKLVSCRRISYKEMKYREVWLHDDVIKWKHFSRYWPFVRGIHQSPVNSPHQGQCGALVFSLICAWINGCVNNRNAGDLRRQRAHYDVTVMFRIVLIYILIATTQPTTRIWTSLLLCIQSSL